MKILLRAAIAAASISSIGSAYANEGAIEANTRFTQLPGVIAQAPASQETAVATVQHGLARIYVTAANRGTYLFAPNENGGGNG